MKIQFFPIDIGYKIENNRTIIYLVGKTLNNEKVCMLDHDYEPYFYVIHHKFEDIVNKIRDWSYSENNNMFFVTKIEVAEKNFLGKKVKTLKIYVNRPKALKLIRNFVESLNAKMLEDDILFERKYLIDNNITLFNLYEVDGDPTRARVKADIVIRKDKIEEVSEAVLKPKVMSIDIETLYKTEEKNNPIAIISFYTNEHIKTLTYMEIKKENVERVGSEADLLTRFKEEIENYKPDLLVGYDSDFTLSYIKRRADKYNINMDLGIDFSPIKISAKNETGRIFGVIHIDLLKFIKKVLAESMEAEDYDLDYISYELFGEKVRSLEEELVNVMKNPERLLEHAQDVESDARLIFNITLKMLPNMLELVKLAKQSLFDISRTNSLGLVDLFLMNSTRRLNEMIINKPTQEEVEKRKEVSLQENFTLKPTPGIYDNTTEINLKAVYPRIIIANNISPETLNCECCPREMVPEKDIWFCKNKKGFIPLVLEELINRKMRVDDMLKGEESEYLKAREYSLNLLINSFYKYFSYMSTRWYSQGCADAVTAYSTFYIKKLMDEASKNRLNVLYIDNDIIFITSKSKRKNERFLEEVNKTLPIIFDVKGHFKRGLFVSLKESDLGAIKKYVLLDENDKLEVKGFESVKSNIPEIVREIQQEILKIVLKDNDIFKTREIIKKIKEDIYNYKIPIEKMTIKTKLQKPLEEYDYNTPYVAAAKKMKGKGAKIRQGMTISYIIGKGKNKISQRTLLPEDAKEEDYDPDYYFNNQILPSLEQIFKLFKEENILLEEKDQSKLDEYFNKKI